MAVGTGSIRLSDVATEMGILANVSLQACIDKAILGGLDATYYTAPLDRLSDFQGYEHISLTSISLGYNGGSSASACAAGTSPYYGTTGDLSTTAALYSDSTGTAYATTGYYSDGVLVKHWDSVSATFTSTAFC